MDLHIAVLSMSKRYSKIIHANDDKKALENYVDYVSHPETRQTKRAQGGSRNNQRLRASSTGFIIPFEMPLVANTVGVAIKYSATSREAFNGFSASLIETGRLKTQLAANENSMAHPEGFTPARATVFVPQGSNAEYVQSKVTKMFYLKYQGKSHSLPFGALNANEEQVTGEKAAKIALLAAGGSAQYFRVSIRPERVQVPF